MSNSVDDYLNASTTGSDKPDENSLEGLKEEINQHLALAGNSALMGLGPKAAYLAGALLPGEKGQGQEYENATDKYLSKAREDNPISGVIAEIVGGLAVPIPGIGAGKAALSGVKGATTMSRFGKAIGEGVIGGGTAGAIRGATQKYGEAGGSGLGEAINEILKGGVEGGIGGAAVGGILGGVGHGLSERANNARIAATGTGMGEMNQAARMTNTRNPLNFMENMKKGELGTGGEVERQRILGHHPFQSGEDVALRATKAADEAGKKLESVVKEVSKDFRTDVLRSTVGSDTRKAATSMMNDPDTNKPMKEGAKAFKDWLDESHFQAGSGMNASVKQLHDMAKNANIALEGFQGFKTPADSQMNSFIKSFRQELSDDMVRAASKGTNKDLARQLAIASNNFHELAMVRGLSADPAMRWSAVRETPLGKGIMSSSQALIWKMLGLPPLAARGMAGITTSPGATPNTLIWLDRLRRSGKLGSREGAGAMTPILTRGSTD